MHQIVTDGLHGVKDLVMSSPAAVCILLCLFLQSQPGLGTEGAAKITHSRLFVADTYLPSQSAGIVAAMSTDKLHINLAKLLC